MIISGQNRVETYGSGQAKEPEATDARSQTDVNNEGAYLAFVNLKDIEDCREKVPFPNICTYNCRGPHDDDWKPRDKPEPKPKSEPKPNKPRPEKPNKK